MMDNQKQVRADMMLLLVTLCWGVSYYLMDLCLTDMGPFTLNAFRFLGAFVVACVISFPKLRPINRTTLKYSFLVGFALVFVYIGATFGVMYTSISNSGFLCALTVVFTPILALIFKKQVPSKKFLLVLLLSVVGIGLLTLNEDFRPALGDILCIMCAVAYAIDLLLTETAVACERVDAFQLGVFQLGVTGLFMLILAMIFETPHFPTTPKIWGSAIFLSIFCTGVAFIVQAVAQQYTSASHVGVIFTLEPVFSGVVAYFFANEVLLPRAYVGAVLMIASLFIMEIDFSVFTKGKKDGLTKQNNEGKGIGQ